MFGRLHSSIEEEKYFSWNFEDIDTGSVQKFSVARAKSKTKGFQGSFARSATQGVIPNSLRCTTYFLCLEELQIVDKARTWLCQIRALLQSGPPSGDLFVKG